ncbi:hypothetical protein [Curtobacterium sp. PhB78]|uniref:hypothetical protein n=1 Tax=Curtobacterium sp. PhB78 TaxID=2485102 RepID=UPI000F49F09F|nr:hypothetical protein [Curtobacterium sp. PhB78]ROS46197.1 hypothetical protein EDF53_1016 [Curtobacterium sp. PhB78]
MTITDQLTPTEYGFRVRATDQYVIDVRKMLFNWRLIGSLAPAYGITDQHGFCYFGRTEEALHRAVAAGLTWEDPLNTEPEGFDKQAF